MFFETLELRVHNCRTRNARMSQKARRMTSYKLSDRCPLRREKPSYILSRILP